MWPVLHQAHAADSEGRPLPRLSQTMNDMLIVMLTAQRRGEVCTSGGKTSACAPAGGRFRRNHRRMRPRTECPSHRWSSRFWSDEPVQRTPTTGTCSNHCHTCVVDRAKKAAAILCKGGVSFQFRAHDLRRTAASYMGEAGVDRFHIAHVLNHRSVTHSTVTAIYDRYRYDKEKRAALEKWAAVLHEIVDVKPSPTTAPTGPAVRANVYEFRLRPNSRNRSAAS